MSISGAGLAVPTPFPRKRSPGRRISPRFRRPGTGQKGIRNRAGTRRTGCAHLSGWIGGGAACHRRAVRVPGSLLTCNGAVRCYVLPSWSASKPRWRNDAIIAPRQPICRLPYHNLRSDRACRHVPDLRKPDPMKGRPPRRSACHRALPGVYGPSSMRLYVSSETMDFHASRR